MDEITLDHDEGGGSHGSTLHIYPQAGSFVSPDCCSVLTTVGAGPSAVRNKSRLALLTRPRVSQQRTQIKLQERRKMTRIAAKIPKQ